MWVQLPASRKARADWLPLAQYPKRHAFVSLGVRKSGSAHLNTSDKPEGAGLQFITVGGKSIGADTWL